MIRLQRGQNDLDKIIRGFPQGSIELDIINKMNDSQTVHNFQNANQLTFEIQLRAQIVKASNSLYRSGIDFAVFRKTRCNEDYWNRQSNGGLKLKAGVNASDAIADIFSNGRKYATECATAMVIIYYMAILRVYPKELFDKTFNSITLMNWHDIDPVIREIGMLNEISDNIPGDRRYFKNPDVDLKTPEWQGENVIDLGNGTYYGHGVGIHNGERIIRALNENRKIGSTVSAYLMEQAGNPNYKKLSKILDNYQPVRMDTLSA